MCSIHITGETDHQIQIFLCFFKCIYLEFLMMDLTFIETYWGGYRLFFPSILVENS